MHHLILRVNDNLLSKWSSRSYELVCSRFAVVNEQPYSLYLYLQCCSALATVATAFHVRANLDQKTNFLYFQGLLDSNLTGSTSK